MNYTYAVLRAAVARALTLYGWLPALGLFHRSELNPFNLADDFLEPLRPLADLVVIHLHKQGRLKSKETLDFQTALNELITQRLQQQQR